MEAVMSLLLLAGLQAAAAAAAPPSAPPAPRRIDFDLATYKAGPDAGGCTPGDGSDIVVCGPRRTNGTYPYERMARIFESGPLDAETGLTGTLRGRAYVESVGLPSGFTSNRIMVGIKLPF
jgi:hypothetical protein